MMTVAKILSLVSFSLLSGFACRTMPAEFAHVNAPSVGLTHLRLIDGTGAPARDDQTIIIDHDRIREVGDSSVIRLDGVAQVLDLSGQTAFPGLVGMHDHLFYALPPGNRYQEMLTIFPKLYLATGVTSIRTAGTIDIDAELTLKQRIDQGKEIGPHIYLSSFYVDPDANSAPNPDGWVQAIERRIPLGINSVKIYTHARLSELAAVVQAAHRHGVRVTGHLCAVGFTEASEAGIDNLEHGLIVDTEFYSRRQPGVCPDWASVVAELVRMDMRGPQIRNLIETLVKRQVAVTSTLPVFETFAGSRIPGLDTRTIGLLTPQLQSAYIEHRAEVAGNRDSLWGTMLRKEMEFEREFVKAGGLLVAGADPTGWGGVVAGYSDQRGLELLVEAGFNSEQAIQIATHNGAVLLGQADQIGTLAKGKKADLVVVRGNPTSRISDVRDTAMVFKDGIRYDSAAIIKGLLGQVGR